MCVRAFSKKLIWLQDANLRKWKALGIPLISIQGVVQTLKFAW